jgi:hypothetical protein
MGKPLTMTKKLSLRCPQKRARPMVGAAWEALVVRREVINNSFFFGKYCTFGDNTTAGMLILIWRQRETAVNPNGITEASLKMV